MQARSVKSGGQRQETERFFLKDDSLRHWKMFSLILAFYVCASTSNFFFPISSKLFRRFASEYYIVLAKLKMLDALKFFYRLSIVSNQTRQVVQNTRSGVGCSKGD